MGAVAFLSVSQSRGYSPATAGALVAVFTTVLAVASPCWGRRIDRQGLPVVVRTCIGVNVVGTVTATVVPGRATLALAAALIALGMPPLGAAMRATWNALLDEGPPRQRAAVFESVVADGVHILGRLLVACTTTLSVAAVLPLQALALVVGGLMLSRDPRVQPAAVPPSLTARSNLLRLWRLLLVTLSLTAAHGCIATAIVVAAPGNSRANGPLLFSVWGVGSVIGGLLLMRWSRSHQLLNVTVPALLALTVLCLAMPWAFSAGSGWAAAALILLGLPVGPTLTGLYLLADRAVPSVGHNELYSSINATIVVGFGVGSIMTGLLAEGVPRAVAGFVPAAALSACAAALILRSAARSRDGLPPNEASPARAE